MRGDALVRVALEDPETLPHDLPAPSRPDRTVARQFDDYFSGRRRRFDLPVGPVPGVTPFRRTVFETLRAEVPYGETISYGELAALSGAPGAARAVGSALRSNVLLLVVPCHRVITGDGRLGGFGGRPGIKRRLLALEGGPVPPG